MEMAAYNIIPVHDVVMHVDHPSLRFPEVRAALAAGARDRLVRAWDPHRADLFDWLRATFGVPA
jgi:callose synthase